MEENIQPTKSKKDAAIERLKAKYPDKSFDNEESVYGQMTDDYDGLDQELQGYKEREGKLSDMLAKDPRSAHLLMSMRDGEDPTVVLMRLFGDEFKDALDNPDLQDKLAEAHAEYVDRVAENDRLQKEFEQNMPASTKVYEEFCSKYGQEEGDKVMSALEGMFADMLVGKYSMETLEAVRNSINHDSDVAEADATGEVRGRNAKIKETLKKREAGDGTAALDGKNNAGGMKRRGGNLFDIARDAE